MRNIALSVDYHMYYTVIITLISENKQPYNRVYIHIRNGINILRLPIYWQIKNHE